MMQPLKGITVLEFSQYLAGPYAGLRLADLGARVIKVERPGSGDACRNLATKDLWVDGDSLLFHTINRNKESFCADLKNPDDLNAVRQLIAQADVMTHNFRPGVMEKIGLDYASVKGINSQIIYGEVSGYGNDGPWVHKPGQDLLAQAVSGVGWLSGNCSDGPVALGLAIADMLCGTHLAQGILAALVRRKKHGIGAKVQASLLESMVDFQFEGLTTYLNNGRQLPSRSETANAHAFLGAPYGIYQTSDHWIAISMGPLGPLAEALQCPALNKSDSEAFSQRDAIKAVLAEHLRTQTTDHWMKRLNAAGIWASEVVDYDQLLNHPAFKAVAMELQVSRPAPSAGDSSAEKKSVTVNTTRCPLRINGQRFTSGKAAPRLGEDTDHIRNSLLVSSNRREAAQ